MAVDFRRTQRQSPLRVQVARAARRLTPWALSVAVHGGVLVILSFALMFIAETGAEEEIIVPNARLSDRPGGRLSADTHETVGDPAPQTAQTTDRQFSKPLEAPLLDEIEEADVADLIGLGPGATAGTTGDLAPSEGARGDGPKSRFFGAGGNAHHIVYVSDHSGSMLDSYDIVHAEIARSIGALSETQSFHVILLTGGRPKEKPPRRLVPATDAHKLAAARFLKNVAKPQGQTDPIPALTRALEVLARADRSRKGKLIYLLTDGEFRGLHGRKEVLELLAEANRDKQVHVNTILHYHSLPEAEELLRQIARDSGGTYTFVGEAD